MRTFNEFDAKMFYVMDAMKCLSNCVDKQVVCIIVDRDNNVVSIGINRVDSCDKNCDDKKNRLCEVSHAEAVAIGRMDEDLMTYRGPLRAYVNLFPCKTCQFILEDYVTEIVTFGMAHKEWVSDKIVLFPHPFYTNAPKRPRIDDHVTECAARDSAYDLMLNGEESSVLQDQHKTYRQLLSKELYKAYSLRMVKRIGPDALIAVTKTTYTK